MYKETEKSSFYAYLLFLIWPFLALISALKNFRMPWAKNIFWVFCMFYGYLFIVDFDAGRDIVRVVSEFQRLHETEISFIEYLKYTGRADILRVFIDYTLSRFTGNYSIQTLVFAAIFGFFLSRNIWYIMERLRGQLLPITIFLLLIFFLVNPIWRINGFRMWTAAHIFIYGLLPYLCEGKRKGIFIAMCSCFVHFSFLVPFGVLLVYTMLGNRLTVYYGFYIAAFFVSEIELSVFNDIIETYMPDIIQDRTSGYRGESGVERHREDVSENVWYARWYQPALNIVVMGFLTMLFFTGRKFFNDHRNWMNLFCFALLFYGVAYLFSSIPSGGRYLVIGNMAALSLIILYVQNRPQENFMRWYVWAAAPALFLYIVVAVRLGMNSISVTSVFGNPIIAIFAVGNDYSLWELIR